MRITYLPIFSNQMQSITSDSDGFAIEDQYA